MAKASHYDVSISTAAERSLRRITIGDRRRIAAAIDKLATNPRPSGAITLKGGDGFLRIRVGDYRVIYTVDDGVLTVLVVAVGHRRDVYKRRR